MIKFFFPGAATASLLLLTNCMHSVMAPPQASVDNALRLRDAKADLVQVGTFSLGPNLTPSMDQSVSNRGANSIESPVEGSFAQYLKAVLEQELKGAGLLDPKSNIVITGSLLARDLVNGISSPTCHLEAQFVVKRNGTVRYDRSLKIGDTWDGNFMGGVAIPAAVPHFEGLFRKMVGTLLDDKDFRAAIAKS